MCRPPVIGPTGVTNQFVNYVDEKIYAYTLCLFTLWNPTRQPSRKFRNRCHQAKLSWRRIKQDVVFETCQICTDEIKSVSGREWHALFHGSLSRHTQARQALHSGASEEERMSKWKQQSSPPFLPSSPTFAPFLLTPSYFSFHALWLLWFGEMSRGQKEDEQGGEWIPSSFAPSRKERKQCLGGNQRREKHTHLGHVCFILSKFFYGKSSLNIFFPLWGRSETKKMFGKTGDVKKNTHLGHVETIVRSLTGNEVWIFLAKIFMSGRRLLWRQKSEERADRRNGWRKEGEEKEEEENLWCRTKKKEEEKGCKEEGEKWRKNSDAFFLGKHMRREEETWRQCCQMVS